MSTNWPDVKQQITEMNGNLQEQLWLHENLQKAVQNFLSDPKYGDSDMKAVREYVTALSDTYLTSMIDLLKTRIDANIKYLETVMKAMKVHGKKTAAQAAFLS